MTGTGVKINFNGLIRPITTMIILKHKNVAIRNCTTNTAKMIKSRFESSKSTT